MHTAAVPVTDTIKQADDVGNIACTLERSRLYAIQTPQVFLLEQYLSAVKQAIQEGKDYTDDCQMLEAMGFPVKLSQGDYRNLKITTPVDLAVAEAFLEEALE